MDLQPWLIIVSVPVALLAAVAVLGWFFRRSVGRSIRKTSGEPAPAPPLPATAQATPLVLRRLEAAEVGAATEQAAGALSEAEASARRARLAYIAGGLVYVAITSLTLTLGISATLRLWPTYVKLILVYFAQWPSLLILAWFVSISLRARLTIIGGYLLLGLLLLLGVLVVPIAPSFSRAATAVGDISVVFVLWPIGGVLLLLARPLRPWLIGVVAILLFVATGVATCFLIGTDKVNSILGLDKFDTSKLDTWFFAEAAILPVVAMVLAWWVLRRRSWPLPVAVIVFLATAAALWSGPLLPDYWKVGPFWLGPLLGVPAYILQVLIVWLVFKLIVRLQERQFLPAQVLHSHLCWGFLTIYLLIVTALGGVYQMVDAVGSAPGLCALSHFAACAIAPNLGCARGPFR